MCMYRLWLRKHMRSMIHVSSAYEKSRKLICHTKWNVIDVCSTRFPIQNWLNHWWFHNAYHSCVVCGFFYYVLRDICVAQSVLLIVLWCSFTLLCLSVIRRCFISTVSFTCAPPSPIRSKDFSSIFSQLFEICFARLGGLFEHHARIYASYKVKFLQLYIFVSIHEFCMHLTQLLTKNV